MQWNKTLKLNNALEWQLNWVVTNFLFCLPKFMLLLMTKMTKLVSAYGNSYPSIYLQVRRRQKAWLYYKRSVTWLHAFVYSCSHWCIQQVSHSLLYLTLFIFQSYKQTKSYSVKVLKVYDDIYILCAFR